MTISRLKSWGGLTVAIITLLFTSQFIGTAHPKDMLFTLQERDLRPALNLEQWIFADGEITPGTAERFSGFVKSKPQLVRGAKVILNSPGGSALEGIRLGELIRSLGYRTNVGAMGLEPMTQRAGLCLSACVFSYLGGEYRYLHSQSKLGVHRFRFTKDLGSDVATDVSQTLAAAIMQFIQDSRADPALFALMAKTSADEIYLLTPDELVNLKVVTNDVLMEKWSFEVHENAAYLKAEQLGTRGHNKLLFYCTAKAPKMMALADLADPGNVLDLQAPVFIQLDDRNFVLPSELVSTKPQRTKGNYVGWEIRLNSTLVEDIKRAKTIGSGLKIATNMFAGFTGINISEEGRQKLSRILGDCTNGPPQNAGAQSRSAKPAAISEADSKLINEMVRNFHSIYKTAGMAGLKGSVEDCYAVASKSQAVRSVKYCFLLDRLAGGLDGNFMQEMRQEQQEYWKPSSVIGRANQALRRLMPSEEARGKILVDWERLHSSSLDLLLDLMSRG